MPLTKTTVSVSNVKGGVAKGTYTPIAPPYSSSSKLPTRGSIVHMNWAGTALITGDIVYPSYDQTTFSIYNSVAYGSPWKLELNVSIPSYPYKTNQTYINSVQINESGDLAFILIGYYYLTGSKIQVYKKVSGTWSLYTEISITKFVSKFCIGNNGNSFFISSFTKTNVANEGLYQENVIEEYTFNGTTWTKTNQINCATNLYNPNNKVIDQMKCNYAGNKLICSAQEGQTIVIATKSSNNIWSVNYQSVYPGFNNSQIVGIDYSGTKTISASRGMGPIVSPNFYTTSSLNEGIVVSSFGTFRGQATPIITFPNGSTGPGPIPQENWYGITAYISDNDYMFTFRFNDLNRPFEVGYDDTRVRTKNMTIKNLSTIYKSGFGHCLSSDKTGKRLAITNNFGETFTIDV